MRTTLWLAGLAALVIVTVLAAQERPGCPRPEGAHAASGLAPGSALRPALDEIQGDQIAAHLQFLADDLLEGRAPSSRGGELAARYLATQLALLGYEPAGANGTFFQPVAIVESVVDRSFVLTAGSAAPFRYFEEVVAFSGVQSPRVMTRGEVVFVGHGIVAPEFNWNDYAGVEQPDDPPVADRIYNGATDNASGLAGTLEIAQALARTRPARSIYVLFTTAEESGLLGAEYFAAHPVLPADAWAGNINIDSLNMAGPSRDIVLLGAERSTLGMMASQLAAERGRVAGPDPAPGNGYFFRSDHFPLAKVGIPALSLSDPVEFIGPDPASARKLHDEYQARRYHQPGDEMQPTWDYTGAVNDMRFLAELGWRIANAPDMPAYHPGEQFARPRLSSTN